MLNESFQTLYHKAIDLLSRREHSIQELRQKLKRMEDLSQLDVVIERLLEKDHLSELRYADMVIRGRANKGYGPRWIRQCLRQKGVAPGVLEKAFSESEVDWDEAKEKMLLKRMGSVGPDFESQQRKRKLLFQRGF